MLSRGVSERDLASLAHSSPAPPDRRHFCASQPPKRERTMPRTARFLYLIIVITTVQAQTCPANFIPVPASGCPANRPCRTTGGCCGSCSASSGQCLAYTFGTTCSSTPISCPATCTHFPPTRPGVVRVVRARPRGPTRLQQDAAVLAVRRITQSSPMFAVRAQAAHTARPTQALDARPL